MTRNDADTLEALASVVSHDLLNPLNVAQSSLDLLEESGPHVERIDRSLSRMERIIEDVVTLARLEGAVDDAVPVDLKTMATDAWDVTAAESATLEAEIDRRIAADPDRLRELLAHLFANAVEHGSSDPENVTVTVGLLADGFYVADDGTGIPEQDREDVFEIGYTTARTGTGLGLPIVCGIADAHGWDVTLTDGDSGGARIEITGVRIE